MARSSRSPTLSRACATGLASPWRRRTDGSKRPSETTRVVSNGPPPPPPPHLHRAHQEPPPLHPGLPLPTDRQPRQFDDMVPCPSAPSNPARVQLRQHKASALAEIAQSTNQPTNRPQVDRTITMSADSSQKCEKLMGEDLDEAKAQGDVEKIWAVKEEALNTLPVLDPRLGQLDTLVDTLTYPDREQDKGDAEGLLTDPTGFDKQLAKMERKQKLADRDRSDPLLAGLDAAVASGDGYPDMEADVRSVERNFVNGNRGALVTTLATAVVRWRQKSHKAFLAGNRTHPELIELDQLVASTLYPERHTDAMEAYKEHQRWPADCPKVLRACFPGKSCRRLKDDIKIKAKQHLANEAGICIIQTPEAAMPFTRSGAESTAAPIDRSKTLLAKLDEGEFSYYGWETDRTRAEEYFLKQDVSNFHRDLEVMKRKQICHTDRLDPLLVELDVLAAGGLKFDDWLRYKTECERLFVDSGGGVGSRARKTLEGMKSRKHVAEQREAAAKTKRTSAALQHAANWVLVGGADSRHTAASKAFIGRCLEVGLVQPASKRARHGDMFDLTDDGDDATAAAVAVAVAVPASPSIDSRSRRCIMCHQNAITNVLMPCTHMCVCCHCAASSVARGKCPHGCGVEVTFEPVLDQITDVGLTIVA
eukprot:m.416067 g.416067  ORF g.416067 m.416067 type:complete len:649 (+) comp29825_c0_seq1:1118-3064(+)